MKRYLIDQVMGLLEPIGFAWLLLVVFAVLFAKRRQWLPFIATGLPASILLAFGSTDLPGALVRELERPYADPKIEALPKADAIVVCGAGAHPARYEVAGMHLTAAADRIVMGLELSRLGKAPTIVLGGSASQFPDRIALESETVRNWIVDRKLSAGEVIALPACADTHDEALFTAELARQRGWKRILLVTSANHMRRALGTFRTAGLDTTPAPCNFMTTLSEAPTFEPPGVPRYGSLGKAATWLHEAIGWIEYRRRGWVDPTKL